MNRSRKSSRFLARTIRTADSTQLYNAATKGLGFNSEKHYLSIRRGDFMAVVSLANTVDAIAQMAFVEADSRGLETGQHDLRAREILASLPDWMEANVPNAGEVKNSLRRRNKFTHSTATPDDAWTATVYLAMVKDWLVAGLLHELTRRNVAVPSVASAGWGPVISQAWRGVAAADSAIELVCSDLGLAPDERRFDVVRSKIEEFEVPHWKRAPRDPFARRRELRDIKPGQRRDEDEQTFWEFLAHLRHVSTWVTAIRADLAEEPLSFGSDPAPPPTQTDSTGLWPDDVESALMELRGVIGTIGPDQGVPTSREAWLSLVQSLATAGPIQHRWPSAESAPSLSAPVRRCASALEKLDVDLRTRRRPLPSRIQLALREVKELGSWLQQRVWPRGTVAEQAMSEFRDSFEVLREFAESRGLPAADGWALLDALEIARPQVRNELELATVARRALECGETITLPEIETCTAATQRATDALRYEIRLLADASGALDAVQSLGGLLADLGLMDRSGRTDAASIATGLNRLRHLPGAEGYPELPCNLAADWAVVLQKGTRTPHADSTRVRGEAERTLAWLRVEGLIRPQDDEGWSEFLDAAYCLLDVLGHNASVDREAAVGALSEAWSAFTHAFAQWSRMEPIWSPKVSPPPLRHTLDLVSARDGGRPTLRRATVLATREVRTAVKFVHDQVLLKVAVGARDDGVLTVLHTRLEARENELRVDVEEQERQAQLSRFSDVCSKVRDQFARSQGGLQYLGPDPDTGVEVRTDLVRLLDALESHVQGLRAVDEPLDLAGELEVGKWLLSAMRATRGMRYVSLAGTELPGLPELLGAARDGDLEGLQLRYRTPDEVRLEQATAASRSLMRRIATWGVLVVAVLLALIKLLG